MSDNQEPTGWARVGLLARGDANGAFEEFGDGEVVEWIPLRAEEVGLTHE